MSDKDAPKYRVFAIRLHDEVCEDIARLAKLSKAGWSQQDIVRMAIEIGLRDLEDAKVDIPEMIRKQAQANRAEAKKPKG